MEGDEKGAQCFVDGLLRPRFRPEGGSNGAARQSAKQRNPPGMRVVLEVVHLVEQVLNQVVIHSEPTSLAGLEQERLPKKNPCLVVASQ
jgi:hypothetical protein